MAPYLPYLKSGKGPAGLLVPLEAGRLAHALPSSTFQNRSVTHVKGIPLIRVTRARIRCKCRKASHASHSQISATLQSQTHKRAPVPVLNLVEAALFQFLGEALLRSARLASCIGPIFPRKEQIR